MGPNQIGIIDEQAVLVIRGRRPISARQRAARRRLHLALEHAPSSRGADSSGR
jgi:hypothetical protein